MNLEPVLSTVNTPFYTADFGKHLKIFDEFQNTLVEKIWNWFSGTLVLTSYGTGIEKYVK